MNNMGRMYANGRGVVKDEAEAVRWYRKGADAGNIRAMNNLAVAYQCGRGVAKDKAEAVRWCRKSSEAGDAAAMNNLGWMYANGWGVARDEVEAVRWYRKSTEAGDAAAMNNLGWMYANGWGVAKDQTEVVRWYRKARELGGTPAGVFRVGSGVRAPRLISKVEPKYSTEALTAKLQGTVLLYVVVDENGNPGDVRVLRPLGLGLDQKAVEAVQTWRFEPGLKDGKPVPVEAQIGVNFRLRVDH